MRKAKYILFLFFFLVLSCKHEVTYDVLFYVYNDAKDGYYEYLDENGERFKQTVVAGECLKDEQWPTGVGRDGYTMGWAAADQMYNNPQEMLTEAPDGSGYTMFTHDTAINRSLRVYAVYKLNGYNVRYYTWNDNQERYENTDTKILRLNEELGPILPVPVCDPNASEKWVAKWIVGDDQVDKSKKQETTTDRTYTFFSQNYKVTGDLNIYAFYIPESKMTTINLYAWNPDKSGGAGFSLVDENGLELATTTSPIKAEKKSKYPVVYAGGGGMNLLANVQKWVTASPAPTKRLQDLEHDTDGDPVSGLTEFKGSIPESAGDTFDIYAVQPVRKMHFYDKNALSVSQPDPVDGQGVESGHYLALDLNDPTYDEIKKRSEADYYSKFAITLDDLHKIYKERTNRDPADGYPGNEYKTYLGTNPTGWVWRNSKVVTPTGSEADNYINAPGQFDADNFKYVGAGSVLADSGDIYVYPAYDPVCYSVQNGVLRLDFIAVGSASIQNGDSITCPETGITKKIETDTGYYRFLKPGVENKVTYNAKGRSDVIYPIGGQGTILGASDGIPADGIVTALDLNSSTRTITLNFASKLGYEYFFAVVNNAAEGEQSVGCAVYDCVTTGGTPDGKLPGTFNLNGSSTDPLTITNPPAGDGNTKGVVFAISPNRVTARTSVGP